ncbi:MAG: hypothetical protein ACFNZM_04455 [Veillonella parvula]
MTKNTKKELTYDQTNMIRLALCYEDYELAKYLDESVRTSIAYSHASLYITEHYKYLIDRLKLELKTLLDCISYEEVFVRTNKVLNTYNTIRELVFNEELGFVKINDIDVEEVKELVIKINERKCELNDDIEELVDFYQSL